MSPRMKWLRSPSAELRVREILTPWLNTPYHAGQRARGIGVDCVQLVVAFLDKWYGRDLQTDIPILSPDAGWRSARLGLQTSRAVLRKFPGLRRVRDGTIKPGDVLMVKGEKSPDAADRLGHAMVAGDCPQTIYHAQLGGRVSRSSLPSLDRHVLRVFRPGAEP